MFVQLGDVFASMNSYGAPEVVRIVGFSKAGKPIVQRVPMVSDYARPSGDGTHKIDVAWLAAHPILKAETRGSGLLHDLPKRIFTQKDDSLYYKKDHFFKKDPATFGAMSCSY